MADLLPSTPRIGARVRARLLGEATLAVAALAVIVGAIITVAEPDASLGSVPIVLEVGQ